MRMYEYIHINICACMNIFKLIHTHVWFDKICLCSEAFRQGVNGCNSSVFVLVSKDLDVLLKAFLIFDSLKGLSPGSNALLLHLFQTML